MTDPNQSTESALDWLRKIGDRMEELHRENAELRIALAMNYSKPSHLYRDDGECQDSSTHPFIDWKRDPWELIKDKMHQRTIAHMRAIKSPAPAERRPPWGTEPWTRAGGDCVCETCGLTFYRHPQESGPGYGSCGDDVLHLVRLCNGKLVHL